MREARAYNQSIYFMVAVPYTLFGIGCLSLYHLSRKARKAQEELPEQGPPEDPPSTPDGASG